MNIPSFRMIGYLLGAIMSVGALGSCQTTQTTGAATSAPPSKDHTYGDS